VPSPDAWEGRLDADRMSIVRPFLETPKSRLVATLNAAGVRFADDPSNRDVGFARPRLRELMPRLATEGLTARRFDVLRRRIVQADDAIEEAVLKAEARLCSGDGPIVIAADGFADMPYEVSQRLLGRAIARVGDEGPVELGKLEVLFEAVLMSWMPQSEEKWVLRRTLAGAMVTLAGTNLTVERAPPRRSGTKPRASGAKSGKSIRKGPFTNAR
jgi:tRNA(Ile)-lysidine synthase